MVSKAANSFRHQPLQSRDLSIHVVDFHFHFHICDQIPIPWFENFGQSFFKGTILLEVLVSVIKPRFLLPMYTDKVL